MAVFYLSEHETYYGKARLKVTQTPNATTNKSSCKFEMEVYAGGRSGTGYQLAGTITINGQTITPTAKSISLPKNQWATIWEQTIEIPHNADGTKTITITYAGTTDHPNGLTCWVRDGLMFEMYIPKGSANCTLDSITRQFKLTISNAHSTVTVNRTSSPKAGAATGNLANNATIYYGDVLKVTYSAASGYKASCTVNNTTFTSGSSVTTTSDVAVIVTATVLTFTLQFTAGRGITISVNRKSSTIGGGNTGIIKTIAATNYASTTDTISVYYNDILNITYTTWNGVTVSGSSGTFNADVTITAAIKWQVNTSLKQYTLHKTTGDHSTLTVSRSESPYASATAAALADGATIYYGDKIVITFSVTKGYKVTAKYGTIEPTYVIPSGQTWTANNNLYVSTETEPMATCHVSNGTSFDTYLVYVSDGQNWQMHQVNVSNGNAWEAYY